MSKTFTESELKLKAEELFKTYPKQPMVHVTKDGNVFLSENLNAAQLHAKSIGKVSEVFPFKNENLQIGDDEDSDDDDDDFNLDTKDEVVPTMKSKVEEIKAYLTLKEILIPEEAKTKEQLLALLVPKNEGE
jgi:hypothetical protein